MFSRKKYKKKIEILALIILILVINSAFQINIYKYFSNNSPLQKDFSDSLKPSYYNVSPIYVDDDNPAQDWAYYTSHYIWCYGSGTEVDPFIIENVSINAGGVGNGIRIRDSEAYFIIRNCHLTNAINGIDLYYAHNGQLINNNCSSNGDSGIHFYYSDNITLINNDIINNEFGITAYRSDDLIINDNDASNNTDTGIHIQYDRNSFVSNNTVNDNSEDGIYVYHQNNSTVYNNIIRRNGEYGIIFSDLTGKNNVSNNILDGNKMGVAIYSSDVLIYNNTVQNSVSFGMVIGGTRNQVLNNSVYSNTEGISVPGGSNNISYNNISLNTNYGIKISGWDNNITNNDLKFSINGIDIQGGGRNKIEGNIIEANSNNGIRLDHANNNSIDQNLIRQNPFGIFLDGVSIDPCSYNIISRNIITENSIDGVYSFECDSNTYLENNISNNTARFGIHLYQSEKNLIRGNLLYNNLNGIRGVSANDNIFERNNFTENNDNGVYLETFCQRNIFSGNEFINNFNTGINIDRDYMWWNPLAYTNGDNLIYNNSFRGNLLHAFSNSTHDFWNSSTIGNYWDDFLTGVDVNDDGISEIPYNVSIVPFTQDYLPIYDDGDDPAPPLISIVSPIDYQMIGNESPSFQILSSGLHINTIWYQLLDGSVNYTISGNSGKINQGLWDEFGNGTVTLRFYVNDSLGYGTSDEVTVRKDINQPNLVINSPISDNLYDNIAPIFNVELSDPNLDKSWYSLDGGLTNFIFTTNSSINQTAWDSSPDGYVLIVFYVNDTAGNLIFDSVTVRKDTHAPVITINSPNSSDLFGNSTISFNVEISDLNLEKMWYTIAGSLTNITFISNGTVNAALWNSFGSGDLTLAFYANDTHGRISVSNVIVSKDIDPPSISIISPTSGETFYVTPPEFEITVSDTHLELVWYTIDGGLTNITITQYTDFISQSVWTAAPQGDITLRFYARDTLGNTRLAEITVKKSSVTQQQPPPGIPGYTLLILLGIISVSSIILILKYRKKLEI